MTWILKCCHASTNLQKAGEFLKGTGMYRSGRCCWYIIRGGGILVAVMFWDNVRQETLFVFFAEARSATSDAKPPWAKCGICRLGVHLQHCEEGMYIQAHRILMHILNTWAVLAPSDISNIEFPRKPTSSYYEHIWPCRTVALLAASFFWLCCSFANSANSLARARPSWPTPSKA